MISYSDALGWIDSVARRRSAWGEEEVPIEEVLGRWVARDVVSPEDVPSFHNSAMDGFAVFSQNTESASPSSPVRVPVVGMVAAGDLEAFQKASALSQPGQAVEIMTGAPVPQGGSFDSVIKIEDVRVKRDDEGLALWIELDRPVRVGENIRRRGSDFEAGHPVLRVGTRVAPEHVMACASLGIQRIRVKRRPRIAVISTGAELVSHQTQTLEPGKIRNSTGPFLVSALNDWGADVEYLGIVEDHAESYQKILEKIFSRGVDVVLSTGAVSMGKFDFVPDVLKRMGARTYFHKTAIRPGKPILFASFEEQAHGPAFFGLPGNPVSTAVGLRFFVEPYLRAALGLEPERPIAARLSQKSAKPKGLRCFYKGKTTLGENGVQVEILKGQSSYVVSALLQSNSWVVLTEEGDTVEKNDQVLVYSLHHSFEGGILS